MQASTRGLAGAGAALALSLIAAVLFFGAVHVPADPLLPLLAMVSGAALLVAAGPHGRLDPPLALALSALPLWLGMQLLPLPPGVAADLSPAVARTVGELWAGPLAACDGTLLVPEAAAGWRPLSIDPWAGGGFLVRVLAAVSAFAGVRAALAARPHWRPRVLLTVAVLAAAEAAYGIVQWLSTSPQILWLPKTAYLDSATGTLVNRNHFAVVLYLGLGAALSLLPVGEGRARRAADDDPQPLRPLFAGLAAAVLLAGLGASQSRTGLLLGALVAVSALPRLLRIPRGPRLVVALAAAVIVVPVAVVALPTLFARLAQAASDWSAPGGRAAVLRAALPMIAAQPLLGTGGGTFEFAFAAHRTAEIRGLYDFAHNDYLQLATEAGLPGLLAALLPVGLVAGRFLRPLRGRAWRHPGFPLAVALAALLVHEAVDFALQIPGIALLAAVLAGALAPPTGAPEHEPDRLSAWSTRLVLALLAAGVLLGGARLLRLDSSPERLQRAAQSAARDALEPQGREASTPDVAALCRALADGARALAARPWSAIALADQARLLVLRRQEAADGAHGAELEAQSRRLADLARRLDPWNVPARERTLQVSLALGDLDQAVPDAEIAVRLEPTRAAAVVRTLRGSALPPEAIVRVLAHHPAALSALLAGYAAARDWESAGLVVSPDVAADATHCGLGAQVAQILVEAHRVEPDRFLEGCLGRAVADGAGAQAAMLRAALAASRLRQSRLDDAAALIAQLPEGIGRLDLEYELNAARGDAAAAADAALRLLARPELEPASDLAVWTRVRAARALAHSGRFERGIEQLERAVAARPTTPEWSDQLRRMRQGDNPFPPFR